MRSFWKIQFINPPEARGQIVGSVAYGVENDGPKVSKSAIWVNNKIAEIVPYP